MMMSFICSCRNNKYLLAEANVEFGPKISKAPIHCVFEQIAFMLVQGHPGGHLSVVDGEVSCGDEFTSEGTAG